MSSAFALRGSTAGRGGGTPTHPKGGNETAAEKLPHEFSHPCRAPHGWFILRVLMLHSNQIFAEAPVLGREHG